MPDGRDKRGIYPLHLLLVRTVRRHGPPGSDIWVCGPFYLELSLVPLLRMLDLL
jgi:hypothetical protein